MRIALDHTRIDALAADCSEAFFLKFKRHFASRLDGLNMKNARSQAPGVYFLFGINIM